MAVLDVKLPGEINLDTAVAPADLLQEETTGPTPSNDPSLGKYAQALATEVAIAEGGRQAAAFTGPIGYIVGAMASGAAGSFAAQRITNPDDISFGRIVADSFINLVPGLKAAKAGDTMAKTVARQGAFGAGIGTAGITGEVVIDEGRLPTIEELTAAGVTGGALGGALGFTGKQINDLLLRHGGSPVEQINKVINENSDPDLGKMANRLVNLGEEHRTEWQNVFSNKLTDLREKYTDASIRTRRLQESSADNQIQEGGPLKLEEYTIKKQTGEGEEVVTYTKDQQDYYAKNKNQEQKIKNTISSLSEESKLIDDELIRTSQFLKDPNTTPQKLSEDLDNYLHAKYALDYNKLKGEGKAGMSTDAANEFIREFERRDLHTLLKGPIDLIRDQVKETNRIAVRSGLLSQKQLDDFKTEYGDNYVPLTREIDESTQVLSADPLDVRSTGIYRDKGSDIEVKSIRQNVIEQAANVRRKSEINETNLGFVRLVDSPGNKEASASILKQFDGKNYKDGVGGSDNVLTFYEDGKAKHMEFADPQLARAFKGTPVAEMPSLVKGMYNFGLSLNKYLGSIYTRYNPDFVIANLFRDRSESFVNNSARLGFQSAFRTMNPYKIINEDMNIIRKKLNKQPAANAKEEKLYGLYDEFVEAGGNVGGLGLTTRQEIIDEIKNLPKNLDPLTGKKTANAIDKWVNKVNSMFEDGTRFATYKAARETGMSPQSAAVAARDSSFDPTKGGTQVGVIRALFLFANPAIQASKTFLRNINPKRNPKVFAGFVGSMFALKTLTDKWNQSVDPDWEEKLRTTSGSDFIKNKNLVFLTGVKDDGTPSYIAIPLGYSMVPFAVAADYASKAARGDLKEDEGIEGISQVKQQIFDSYNPTGGSLVPTMVRPYTELMFNKDGLGRIIRPEWMETRPMFAKDRMYPHTMKTYGGEVAYSMAETAEALGIGVSPESIKHLFQVYTGGIGGTMGRLANIASDAYNKGWEGIKKKDIPLARRFFGDGYKQKFEDRAGYQSEIDEFTKIDNSERARDGRIATNIFSEIKRANEKNSPEIARDVLLSAIESGELSSSVVKRLETKIKNYQKGLTQTDARVKQLSVKVRARYLLDQMKTKPLPELKEYIADQMRKGILTRNVLTELSGIDEFKNLTLRGQE